MLLNLGAVAAVVSIALWYLLNWQVFFNSDFAMIGLLGERILSTGETYLYVPKVGYQGLLIEGYLSAILFKWFGMSPQVLHATSILMWFLFAATYYFAVKAWFSKRIAIGALWFISLSSPFFFGNVLRTQPNYPETYALGCFLFWTFKQFLESHKRRYFFVGCLAAGFGFYLYSQILYFVLSIIVVMVVRSAPAFAPFPPWRNRTLQILLGLGVAASFFPTLKVSGNPIPGPSLGVVCVLIWLGVFVWQNRSPLKGWLLRNQMNWLFGALFFFIGYSPNLYHRWVLGRFTKSGIKLIKFSEELWMNIKILVFNSSDFLCGSEFHLISILFSVSALGIFLYFLKCETLKKKNKILNPFGVLGLIIVLSFVSSRSVTEPFSLRYILCFHLCLAVSVSFFLDRVRLKRPVVAAVFFFTWSAVGFYSNWRAPQVLRKSPVYSQLTQWRDIEPVVDYLNEQKLFYGYGDYWFSYLANFVTNQKLTYEALGANYLPFYADEVRGRGKLALVLGREPIFSFTQVRPSTEGVEVDGVFYQIVKKELFRDWQVWVLEKG